MLIKKDVLAELSGLYRMRVLHEEKTKDMSGNERDAFVVAHTCEMSGLLRFSYFDRDNGDYLGEKL